MNEQVSVPVRANPMWIEVVGWTGTVSLLAGFFANTQGMLSSESPWYLLANLVGAAGVGVHAYRCGSWPTVTVEVLWSAVALLGLVRFML